MISTSYIYHHFNESYILFHESSSISFRRNRVFKSFPQNFQLRIRQSPVIGLFLFLYMSEWMFILAQYSLIAREIILQKIWFRDSNQ